MAIGIALALLASLCFAVGNLLEKVAVDRMEPFSLGNIRGAVGSLASSKWWLIGAAVSLIGLPIQILAYSRIAISIVQSIGVAGVVLLVAFARVMLHEHLGRRETIGIGCALASLMLVLATLSRTSDVAVSSSHSAAALLTAMCTLGAGFAVLATPVLRHDRSGFVYGSVAGLFYGLSGLGAKGIATLISRYGWPGWFLHAVTSPYLYLFFGSWALGLAIFQAGIQRCRVGVVGSVSTVVSSAFVVAMGMVIFDEHLPASPALRALRIVGFLGILAGSVLVGWGGSQFNAVGSQAVSAVEIQ